MSVQTLIERPGIAPARPRQRAARVIRDDAEALAAVATLAARFAVGAAERDHDRILPRAEIEALSDAGFYGVTIPAAHGGADVSAVTVAELFARLAAADPSIGQIPQNHFCWLPVVDHGTPAQAEFFFARFLAGERIGNAHSEDTKRRPGEYEHRLTRVEGGWTVTGRKYYSTGAIFADWIPFLHHEGEGEARQSRMYFVWADQPGVRVIDDWDGFGQRTTASGTTVFEDAFIPDEYVFPLNAPRDIGRSFVLNANLIHGAIDLGIAEAVLEDARHYILTQNRPWTHNPNPTHAEEPFVIRDFGRLGVVARTARVALIHAAGLVDAARREATPEAVLAARLAIADARILTSEAATKLSHEFFALTGARATLGKHALDRHWRNARTHSLHDPLRWKEFHLGNYYLNGVVPLLGSYI
jgi:SfnB family sulfur acquisition oxidoreductase